MIEMKPDRYYIGIWFGDLPQFVSRRGNWMSCVWREHSWPEGQWRVQFRFRYYEDPAPWAPSDSSWYKLDLTGETEETASAKVDQLARVTCVGQGVEFYPLRCDGEAAGGRLKTAPPLWMNMKIEKEPPR